MELIAFQAQSSFQQEGLPYWMFYFLLCIILLLVVFIFLRDKQLRMRISAFLAGARRRSVLIRLKFQLKRERLKRGSLLRELGKKAWEEGIPVRDGDFLQAELSKLLEKKKTCQMEWKKAFDELERVHRQLETSIHVHKEKMREKLAEKSSLDALQIRSLEDGKGTEFAHKGNHGEKEKEEIREKIKAYEDDLKGIEAEARREHQELEKEIHYWQKLKDRLEHRIKNIEAQEEALFYSLGKNLEEARVNHHQLDSLYSQIDTINQRISTLLHRIETLSGG